MTGSVKTQDRLTNTKYINCALLLHCAKTFAKRIERAQYVSNLWSQGSAPKPCEGLSPCAFGWKKDEGILVPEWFEGSSVPTTLLEGNVASIAANNVSMQIPDGSLLSMTKLSYGVKKRAMTEIKGSDCR